MTDKNLDLLKDIDSVMKAIDAETDVFATYIKEPDVNKKEILTKIFEQRKKYTISLAKEMSKKHE